MSDAPTPAAVKPKSKLPLIVGAVVALAAIGGGAYFYMQKSAAPAAAVEHVAAEHGIVTFEPFVVNLADPGSPRFLRITLQLVVDDELQAEHMKEKPVMLAQARSAILELLTLQTSDQLITSDGKAALKTSIAEKVGTAIAHLKVVDVLFSDFVVQL
jgi:flagellar FliL protein